MLRRVARIAVAIVALLAPLADAGAVPPAAAQGRPQPADGGGQSVDTTTSPTFGGFKTDGGDDVRAVLTVPEIPCGGEDTGVFPALGIRNFGEYYAYSGVFAVCRDGEPDYSAALYAPGIERHFGRLPTEPGDRVRVKYHALGDDRVVSIKNLTQGWRRKATDFSAPLADSAEVGDYVVSLDGTVVEVPEFRRHAFSSVRVDGRAVDDSFTKVTLGFADQVVIIPWLSHRGRFALWTKDPDLVRGFPVFIRDGSLYQAGVRINATVANIDDDPELEICGTGMGTVPATCWNPDTSLVDGWRNHGTRNHGAAYVSIGSLEPVLDTAIVATYGFGGMTAFDGHGDIVDGWPRRQRDSDIPASMATNVDGTAMVFLGELDTINALGPTGASIPGWPVEPGDAATHFQTPAIADVDGVPGLEIFSATAQASPSRVYAYHEDGTPLPGYPQSFGSQSYTYPALGDVDGDGAIELVIAGRQDASPYRSKLFVYEAATGRLEGSHVLSDTGPRDGVVALADLGVECGVGTQLSMIVQTDETLEVVTWDGEDFADRPGFPVTWSTEHWVSNSAPVVGDLDADGRPDIAFTGQYAGDGVNGSVFAFDADGDRLPRFPKDLPIGGGGVPAIADVDLDGRNELVIKGSYTRDGSSPSMWIYDLGAGSTAVGSNRRVEWGQFMNTSDHRSAYETPSCG